MKAWNVAVALGVAAALGCGATATKVVTHEKFDPAAARYIVDEGPHTISGQSFLRQVNGEIRTCAGYQVSLTPVTTYAAERMRIIYGSDSSGYRDLGFLKRQEPATTDLDYMRYARATLCDAAGNFEFTKVADGSYYVITAVVWGTGQPYTPPQGGYMLRRVTAGPSSTKLIITRQ